MLKRKIPYTGGLRRTNQIFKTLNRKPVYFAEKIPFNWLRTKEIKLITAG